MLRIALHKYLEKKKADKIWTNISMFFLTIIIINILAGFIL